MILKNKKTISFYTIGCKLNFSETSTIERSLIKNGYQKVKFGNFSDISLINTCSVTENADKECKKIINRILKINSKTFIIVIGCYAQINPNKISNINGVDLILGAREKFNIVKYLNTFQKNETTKIITSDISDVNFYDSSYSIGNRTRAFLKIQDGCDYKCTYCTIPLARGKSRSDNLSNILNNIESISLKGVKEIVLTGVNIGDYKTINSNNKKYYFLDLLSKLDKIDKINRFRISSIEPNLLNNKIIDKFRNSSKFVPHFHIPLQSGNDIILKKMGRRYMTATYSDRINRIKSMIPDACIGADIIVGFPGETDAIFLETANYIKSLDISYLHVFTYSERNNTIASNLNEVVPIEIRKKRNRILQTISEKKKRQFYLSQIGKIKKVLWENNNKNGMMYGLTENYIRIKTLFNEKKVNTLEKVILKKFSEKELIYLI